MSADVFTVADDALELVTAAFAAAEAGDDGLDRLDLDSPGRTLEELVGWAQSRALIAPAGFSVETEGLLYEQDPDGVVVYVTPAEWTAPYLRIASGWSDWGNYWDLDVPWSYNRYATATECVAALRNVVRKANELLPTARLVWPPMDVTDER
jgi:hypothetical protein